MSKTNVLYIAGYGRSGSTILGVIIGSLPGIFNGGEIAALPKYIDIEELKCPCGSNYIDCPVWGRVIEQLPGKLNFVKEMGKIQEKVESLGAPVKMKITESNTLRKKYDQYLTKFFKEVAKTTNSSLIVDASKTARGCTWRPVTLQNTGSIDVYVLHLIRSLCQVVSSCKKGSNTNIERGINESHKVVRSAKSIVGWIVANASVHYGSIKRLKKATISYESMLIDESRVVKSIIENAQIMDILERKKNQTYKKEEYKIGHMVGGNRLARRNKNIKIKNTAPSINNLNVVEKMVCKLFDTICIN